MKKFLFFLLAAWGMFLNSGFSQIVTDYASGLFGTIGIETDGRGWIWASQAGNGMNNAKISVITGPNKVYTFMSGLPSDTVPPNDIGGTMHIFFSKEGKLLIMQGGPIPDTLGQSILVVDTTGFVPGVSPPKTIADVEEVYRVGDYLKSIGDSLTNPYTFAYGSNNDMYIADAADNAIVKQENSTGNFSIFARFPNIPNNTGIGGPFSEVVPTGIVFKDNHFYVGSLTGFPFANNASTLYEIDTAGNINNYKTGLTTIVDVTLDPDDNIVLLSHASFNPPPNPFMPYSGSVMRLNNGSLDTLVSGLNRPTSVRFKNRDEFYVSTLTDGKILHVVTNEKITYGDSDSLGNGKITAWVKTDSVNNPKSIGMTLTEDVLTNLPAQPTLISLNLPKNASDTLFKHIYFGWNPMGHPPAGIYSLPHFDLHFYVISKDERLTIPGGPDPVKVESRFIPPDYVSDPAGIPAMGTHWTDTTASEFHGETFTKTFVYGFAKGQFVFYEPMFTKVYLESHPHFSENIKQPAEFQKAGYYPTTYTIDYDSTNQLFNFEITDFVWHNAAITDVENTGNNNIPEKFTLFQNYPNPFNPSTQIKWQIPESGFVLLKIYDILGNEVITLVNEYREAGDYENTFDGSNLSTGLYLYRLISGNNIITKKMLMIK